MPSLTLDSPTYSLFAFLAAAPLPTPLLFSPSLHSLRSLRLHLSRPHFSSLPLCTLCVPCGCTSPDPTSLPSLFALFAFLAAAPLPTPPLFPPSLHSLRSLRPILSLSSLRLYVPCGQSSPSLLCALYVPCGKSSPSFLCALCVLCGQSSPSLLCTLCVPCGYPSLNTRSPSYS